MSSNSGMVFLEESMELVGIPSIRSIVDGISMLTGTIPADITVVDELQFEKFVLCTVFRLMREGKISFTVSTTGVVPGARFVVRFTYCIPLMNQSTGDMTVGVARAMLDNVGEMIASTTLKLPSIVPLYLSPRMVREGFAYFMAKGLEFGSLLFGSSNEMTRMESGSASLDLTSLRAYEDLDKSSVMPMLDMHGMCWCCASLRTPLYRPIQWPPSHANDWKLDAIRFSRLFFKSTGGPSAPIDYPSQYGHGRCLCCYVMYTPAPNPASESTFSVTPPLSPTVDSMGHAADDTSSPRAFGSSGPTFSPYELDASFPVNERHVLQSSPSVSDNTGSDGTSNSITSHQCSGNGHDITLKKSNLDCGIEDWSLHDVHFDIDFNDPDQFCCYHGVDQCFVCMLGLDSMEED